MKRLVVPQTGGSTEAVARARDKDDGVRRYNWKRLGPFRGPPDCVPDRSDHSGASNPFHQFRTAIPNPLPTHATTPHGK